MPDSFGTRLRRRREEKQIDLIAISEGTKIKLPLLEGLERDDVSMWPSGIFRRAYIRAYAQFIGLDPDEVVREFCEAYPDPGDASVATTAAAAAAAEEEAAARNAGAQRLRTIVDSALGSLSRWRWPAAPDGTAAQVPPPSNARPVVRSGVPAERPAEALETRPAEGPDHDVPSLIDEPPQYAAPPPDVPPVSSPIDDEAPVAAPTTSATSDEVPLRLPAADGPPAEPPRAAAEPRTGGIELAPLESLARLCTDIGRVAEARQLAALLEEAAQALSASGLIVWLWDSAAEGLRPALVHGYSERVLAQLPAVRSDADNPTAAAFRDACPCEVPARGQTSGALVVPMLIPEGCAGVLALELQPGTQPSPSLRAMTTIVAAALTQLVLRSSAAAREQDAEAAAPALSRPGPPTRPMKVRR